MIKKIDEGSNNYGYKSGSTTINPIHQHKNHHNNLHNFPLCNVPQQQKKVKRDMKLNERTVFVGSNGLLQGCLPKKSSGLIKYNNNNINNNSINSNNYNTYNSLNTKSK